MVKLSDELAESIENSGNAVPDGFASAGVENMERLFPYAGEFEARTRAEGLHRWYRVRYDEEMPATKAGLALKEIPGVEIVEQARRSKSTALPFNDPHLSKQWHYCNDGTTSHWKKGADINVFPVWENITTGSPEVVVAVVDGGIDLTHEDLAAHVDASNSYNFVYGHTGKTIVAHDHGTHVAGTVAAVNNNGKGVCGVAGGNSAEGRKGVTLISCQIFQTINGQDQQGDDAEAIKWGADHGAVISQNSWGFQFNSESEAGRYGTPSYIKVAIDYFNKYAGFDKNGRQVGPMAGGVVFFAAGNDGWKYAQPAMYEGCIAVGSFACDGTPASYSNYGNWVDIAAPGGDQYYGKWEGNDFYSSMVASTVPGSKYASYPYIGTSMACPHVSGVAALLVSYFGGQGFTREDLIHKLIDGAVPGFITGSHYIGPKLDAWGSFTVDGEFKPDTPAVREVTIDDDTAVITMTVPGDAQGNPVNQLGVIYSRNSSDISSSTPLKTAGDARKITVDLNNARVGDIGLVDIPGLDYKTTYYYSVFSKSKQNSFSDCSEVKSFYVKENLPPYMDPVLEDCCTGKPGTFMKIDLSTCFHDPEGKQLAFSAESEDPDSMDADTEGNTLYLYPKQYGETAVKITASDGHNAIEHTITVVCRDNSVTVDLYPNPVSTTLYLRTAVKCEAAIRIISASGAEVISTTRTLKPTGTEPVDVRSLASGVYTVSVSIVGDKTYNRDIVKL